MIIIKIIIYIRPTDHSIFPFEKKNTENIKKILKILKIIIIDKNY